MDQNKIESFISIIETGSITNAAEKLYISQSTLSDRLSSLEEELGTRLIHRGPGNKKLALTKKGIEFLDFSSRYLELNKEIEDWKDNRERGQLKISAPQSINSYLFYDFYKKFSEKTQHHLDISSHWNRTVHNMVYSFNTDIGIVSRPYQSNQVLTESLIEEPLKVIYDKRFANYNRMNELEKRNQIYIGWGPTYEDWYNQHWDSNESPKVSLDSPELLIRYLETSNAWAIVPLCVYNKLVSDNQYIQEVETDQPIKRVLYLMYQKGVSDVRNQVIKDFIVDLYRHILEMENKWACKVLMDKPESL